MLQKLWNRPFFFVKKGIKGSTMDSNDILKIFCPNNWFSELEGLLPARWPTDIKNLVTSGLQSYNHAM